MSSIHVCVPVLRRYDLLQELLESLHSSEVQPASVRIIDNGQRYDLLYKATMSSHGHWPVQVYQPQAPLGLAESWNWFIQNVPEERIISNDDITFYPETLGAFAAQEGDLVFAKHGYSCFLIRDSCVEKVGFFDETISPGYAYYEDCDYSKRMELLVGIATQNDIQCRIDHGGSQTNHGAPDDVIQEHHRRFMIAQRNYVAKWGPLS